MRVLIADDEALIRMGLRTMLEEKGHKVVGAATDGASAIQMARTENPEVILLDIKMPGMDGLEAARKIMHERPTPIVMLTARTTEADTLHGLDLGADDYIAKPFSPRELVARVRAVLRRTIQPLDPRPSVLQFNGLLLDTARHNVWLDGQEIPLTPTEFKILETFVRAPGRVFSRQELVERAFGWDFEGQERTVDAHVMNLRKKMTRPTGKPPLIVTVYGIGYSLSEEKP
ncbi:MAG TPA: response regulator transcription factor [Acidobacteriota bacterium]|nr:response regulator transcription factor [Acidobacteriota bacterium]